MKQQKFEVGIRALFTFATILEIAVAFAIVISVATLFHLSINEVPAKMLIGILIVTIGGVTSIFINKLLLSPIKRLSEAMDEVANGNFEVKLEADYRIREIENIYEKFNLMTRELRSTEILQSDFVSNVSHEIKTPITSIEGYTMLLQKEETSEESKKLFVEKILFNTRRLSELVGNILLLSKIDNQAIETQKKKFRLDEQIRQVILILEPKWLEKEIEFDVELDSITYEGNDELIYHIWSNLLDNAIKFSPQGRMIRLRLREEEENYVFVIEDEGPGIPQEDQQRIFQKFYQADGSRKQEGNGLGLALVKNIVDLYHGEIVVENLPKQGCRFIVKLNRI